MLKRLEISNYALIENVVLNLDKGFTAITGETGAGKSIILKALNLLMGDRADSSVLKQSEKKCVLEAEFDIASLDLNSFFDSHELDYEPSCIIRREFNATGKSRTFVNDTPVQLAVLKELGKKLISIHTQHETLEILNADFQLDVIDHYAGVEAEVKTYKQRFNTYRNRTNRLIELQIKDRESRKEKDYLAFLLKELEDANLDGTDIDALKAKSDKIDNLEKINTAIQFSRSVFENSDFGPTVGVKTLLETFEDLKQYDSGYADLAARLLSLKIELDDIEAEISNLDSDEYFSDDEVIQVKEKLEQFNALSFKHNLQEVEQLVELQANLSDQLSAISTLESDIVQLEKEIAEDKEALNKIAGSLRKKRLQFATKFEKAVKERLTQLAMPEAELSISFSEKERLSATGLDKVDFLFKTNLGGSFAAVKKVASGGELSRLMLSILSILSESKSLPTLIFDEIDTGVSGEVAAKIATEFDAMGQKIQIIAITHLAQVAGRGQSHLHVYKEKGVDKTTTSVREIKGEERVDILAGIISGEQVTEVARENARNLLSV